MDKSWFPTVSEMYNPLPVFWVENECVWSKMTYEPKLFGMHSGSVLSGSNIRNVNTDLKMLSLPVFWVENG